MNISLTWAHYALITGVCLIGYYIVIGLVYYRKDINQLLHPKEKNRLPGLAKQDLQIAENASLENVNLSDNQISEEALPVDSRLQDTRPGVQDFVDEIEAYTNACGKDITKEALLNDLRNILHKYPALTSSSLRSVLAGIIATASENNCSIQWREDELNELWNG